jgi:hypothetical protein
MRAVTIPVKNNLRVEIFVEKLKDGFEIWGVGKSKEGRMVLDHHLTHDNLEALLEYAQPKDLVWRDASHSEIPAEKHQNAIEREETIARGVYWDYENRGEGAINSVTCHLGAIAFLVRDRKDLAAAKKMMHGQWTDGILTFTVMPNNRLEWFCEDKQHWLNKFTAPAPTWWNFGKWELFIMSNMGTPQARGIHFPILRVNEHELHVSGGGRRHRLAYVFRRDRD